MLSKLSMKSRFILLIGAFFISILLSITLYRSLYVIESGINETIYITALNEKDDKSYSTEVRISKIVINNKQIDFNTIELVNGWDLYDNYLIAAYNISSPTTLEIKNNDIKTLDIQFVKQVGSGYVKIAVGDYEEIINLYSEGDWDLYDWSHDFTSVSNFNLMNNIPFFILLYLFWASIISFILYYIMNKKEGIYKRKLIFIPALLLWILSFYSDKMVFNYSGINVLSIPRILVIKILYLFIICLGFNFIYKLFIVKQHDERKRFLRYFIPYWCLMIIFVILTWPGIWRWDEFAILENMVNWDVNLWQNYLTSIYYMIGFMLFPLPGGFVLFQVTIISVVVGFSISNVEKYIKNPKLCYAMYIPFLLFPTIDQNLYPLRMTLYTYIEVIYFISIFNLYNKNNYINLVEILKISILTAVLASWRTEGILFIAITPIIFWGVLRKNATFKGKVLLTISSVFLSCIFMLPQNYLSNKWGGDTYKVSAYVEFLDDLVKIEYKENPDSEVLYQINNVLNVEIFNNYETGEQAFWNGGVREGFNEQEYKDFQKAVLELLIKHIDIYIEERFKTMCKTSGMYENYSNVVRNVLEYYQEETKVLSQDEEYKYNFFKTEFEYNYPINRELRENIISLLESRKFQNYNETNWTYALNFNLFIPIAVVLALWSWSIIKKINIQLIICTILLLQTGIVFLIAPAPYFMYYFPIYLGGYFLLTFNIINKLENKKRKEKIYE